MMIATEKPGCSNLKKYSFKRAIVLIYADVPEKISRVWLFTKSVPIRAKSDDPYTSRHITNSHVVRTNCRTLITKIYSVKKTPAAAAKRDFFRLSGLLISMHCCA